MHSLIRVIQRCSISLSSATIPRPSRVTGRIFARGATWFQMPENFFSAF